MAAKGRITQSWSDERPKNYYLDCVDRPRPCPWVGCKHNLMLDVNEETGSITLNVGRETEPQGTRGRPIMVKRRTNTIPARNAGGDQRELMLLRAGTQLLFEEFQSMIESDGPVRETCVLDCVQGETTHTLEEVGDKLSVTRERIRQIESKAEAKIRKQVGEGSHSEWAEMND